MSDRPPDFVTLMWDNRDGTYTTEVTDFSVSPPQREIRLLHDQGAILASAEHFAAGSTIIPSGIDDA